MSEPAQRRASSLTNYKICADSRQMFFGTTEQKCIIYSGELFLSGERKKLTIKYELRVLIDKWSFVTNTFRLFYLLNKATLEKWEKQNYCRSFLSYLKVSIKIMKVTETWLALLKLKTFRILNFWFYLKEKLFLKTSVMFLYKIFKTYFLLLFESIKHSINKNNSN